VSDSFDDNWIEIKISFQNIPDPLTTKRQLLTLLNEHSVPDVVESYYDGMVSAEPPDEIEAAILNGEDHLPVVIYLKSKKDLSRTMSLIERQFEGYLSPQVRVLDVTDLDSPWSEGDVFETERFVITSIANYERDDRQIILINPGSAFGDGRHVSTLAMLRCLEMLPLQASQRVLDVGTGNGVLLIAAAKLGAGYLVGSDLSQEILNEAVANFSSNQIVAHTILTAKIPREDGPFDLALVNIPIAGTRPLISELLAATTGTAEIIFAGFTSLDGKLFTKELEKLGLVFVAEQVVRGWSALRFRKNVVV